MNDNQHPASVDVGGSLYLRDAKGNLVPLAAVKPADLLMDEAVRALVGKARGVSGEIGAFKALAFAQVSALQALLAQDYGAAIGGAKGNLTLLSIDGCLKVQVQVSDQLDFGPELQAAKTLIDTCLTEWAANSGAELRAIVTRAFSVDKAGQINRAELFMLLRTNITDARWVRAMDAIRDSMRVVGSRRYVRLYERDAPDGAWRAIPLDIAAA